MTELSLLDRQYEQVKKYLRKQGLDPEKVSKEDYEVLFKIICSNEFTITGSTKLLSELLDKFIAAEKFAKEHKGKKKDK